MPAADFEDLRSIAFGDISGSFADVGSVTTHRIRVILVSNATDGHVIVTWDDSKEMIPVLAGTAVVIDVSANRGKKSDDYVIPIGAQFAVKQITAPTNNSVYIACLH